MKTHKILLLVSVLALMLGAASCQKEKGNKNPDALGETYMSLTLDLSIDPVTKAEDGVHNDIGKWAGNDKINNVDIYILYSDSDKPVERRNVALTTPPVTGNPGTDGIYQTDAFKVKPSGGATVKIYVVVNNTDNATAGTVENMLNAATTISNFETAYNATYTYGVGNGLGIGSYYAKIDGGKDLILMSGKPLNKEIKDNVTKEMTKMPGAGDNQNHFKFEVRRSAARVAVTMKSTMTLPVNVKEASATNPWGTLNNLKWSYAQFENKSKLLWDETGTSHLGSTLHYTTKSTTESYNFIPANRTEYTSNAGTHYNYSLISTTAELSTHLLAVQNADNNPVTIADVVNKGNMRFITETTHKYGEEAAGANQTGYRKGNTPYVMIQGIFVPHDDLWAAATEKTAYNDAANTDKHLYYNPYNGKFYASLANAIAGGVPATVVDDGIITYTNSKVYYFAWLNPDNNSLKEVLNSPIIRNNIYNVNIASFSKVGFSGNPYNPLVTNSIPVDPDEIVPEVQDFLKTKETYMSAEITVINWGVHSADIDF